MRSIWPNWQDERPYAALVLGILFVLFLGGIVKIVSEAKALSYIGRAPSAAHTIVVTGEGKVTASPDTASVSLGVVSQKATQEETLTDATTKMNTLVARVKALGISDTDMKTQQYTVYPRYDYPNGRQVASGYEAQQQLVVTVRNKTQLPEVLRVASEAGANQISSLSQVIDDPEPLREQARAKAVANAKTKAAVLARTVGVRLGGIVSFSENAGEAPLPPLYYAKDMGGSGGAPTPSIEGGSQDVVSQVTLTYEIF